jgi:hypothetical protein
MLGPNNDALSTEKVKLQRDSRMVNVWKQSAVAYFKELSKPVVSKLKP